MVEYSLAWRIEEELTEELQSVEKDIKAMLGTWGDVSWLAGYRKGLMKALEIAMQRHLQD